MIYPRRDDLAEMLRAAHTLFDQLIDMAQFAAKDKKIRYAIGRNMSLERFLVPTQSVLMYAGKYTTNSPKPKQAANDSSYFQNQEMFISKFDEIVEVANSKAKPKILTLQTTCGRVVKFLCKQEANGDLRKDARLMEFNTVGMQSLTRP